MPQYWLRAPKRSDSILEAPYQANEAADHTQTKIQPSEANLTSNRCPDRRDTCDHILYVSNGICGRAEVAGRHHPHATLSTPSCRKAQLWLHAWNHSFRGSQAAPAFGEKPGRVLCKTFRNEFPKDAATVCVDQAFRER